MFLKAEQLWRIATVYDKVAEAEVGVPSPQRSAFARKAKHLRMLARIAAKIEATGFANRRGLSPAKRVLRARGAYATLERQKSTSRKSGIRALQSG